MSANSVHSDLEQVFDKCASQPLDKANVRLLQRACGLSMLAERVYNPAQISDANLEGDLYLAGVSPQRSSADVQSPFPLEARLLAGPLPAGPVHAIWDVQNLGVVVAFRGTAALEDIYADIGFQPMQLADSTVKLHGSIYTGAASCIANIQAVYYRAAQSCNSQHAPALYLTGTLRQNSCLDSRVSVKTLVDTTGHSLGGGYANCAFLEILASKSPMSSGLLRGGVYTFGAPLVVYRHEELQYTAQAIQLLFLEQHQLPSGWSQLPVYNFVNGVDIVPRLLGQTSIHTFAKLLALMLPQTYSELLHKTATVAGNFVPFGTYCLILGDAVRLVDSAAKPQLLHITVEQLLGGAEQVGQQSQSAPYVLQRLLSDHCSSAYTTALLTAMHSHVPVLFMGGQTSDYQSVLVQRQSPGGMVQEVALKHTKTGIVGHNAFREIPLRKVLMGAGAAAAGSLALKEVVSGTGPKDIVTVAKAVIKGAGNVIGADVAAAQHALTVVEAAVQQHIPSLGKVLVKSLAGTLTSGAVSIGASPVLGVANLVTGVLNLGLTGYNTYQLRGISKLQKVMNDKLVVMDSKLDGIAGEMQVANKGIEGLSKGQERMDDKLDWIMRSATEVTYMCDAIMQGMDHLDCMLQSQATRLDTVVQYCQALQQDQQMLIQGQDILISGQKVLLQEVASLHRKVASGTDTLSTELRSMSMNNFREKIDVVTGLYLDLLKYEGTQAKQANLVDRACQLQACIKTWLSKIAPSTADRVALRQPFVEVSAIAAIAWDTANATTAPVSNGRVFLETGVMNVPKRDEFSHRKEIIKQIDVEILALMQHSTIFTFATTFHFNMLRYVYMRRALQGRASIDEVLPMTVDSLPAGGTITYDAMDLMWTDGLDDLRAIFGSENAVNADTQLPGRWICTTVDELQWFCICKGLPDGHRFQELPMVHTYDLLCDLGVPEADIKFAAGRLTVAALPVLRKAVLPQFLQQAVALMADQLPELKLLDKMQKGLLFVG